MASESESNKYMKHAAEMRTLMELYRKSKAVPGYIAQALEEEIRHILVSRNIIYPQLANQNGIDESTSYQDKKRILGIEQKIPPKNENDLRFQAFMSKAADDARKTNWRFRIAQESKDKQEKGWYPFFVTLTVDPILVDSKEMWQQGKEWQKLVRALSKVVTDELGHIPYWKKKVRNKKVVVPYRPLTDYMTYCGVIEHGKSREHHHLHALLWMREIPESWKKCPNRNCIPEHRIHNRCRELETYWNIGISTVNYFRSVGDIWELKHGFALPLKDGKPMKVAPADYAGEYLIKYLQKDHKEWQHRVKATKNLGMNRLYQTIKSMKQDQVEALTWRPARASTAFFLSKTHTVPLGLVRSIAKRVNFYNQFRYNTLDYNDLMMVKQKPFIKMLKSVHDGARPDRMPFAEFYDFISRHLNVQIGYCEIRLAEAHEIVAQNFRRLKQNSKPVKIGGNKVGSVSSI